MSAKRRSAPLSGPGGRAGKRGRVRVDGDAVRPGTRLLIWIAVLQLASGVTGDLESLWRPDLDGTPRTELVVFLGRDGVAPGGCLVEPEVVFSGRDGERLSGGDLWLGGVVEGE